MLLCGWIIFFIFLKTAVHSLVTSPDVARRFGVTESLLEKKSSWKVECSETSPDFFERFRDYDETTEFLKELKTRFSNSKLFEIGTTSENRPIYALEISGGKNSPVILALAGVHGREWTSISALLYALKYIDPEAFQGVSFLVVPILNPDGYAKTFSGGVHVKEKFSKSKGIETEEIPNRYWRKNAIGVDLNRNFGSSFGNDNKTKSLRIPSSDVYQGKSSFSEPETRAMKSLVESYQDRLVALIDFHCCIGAVLPPPFKPESKSAMDNEYVGKKIVAALSRGGQGVTKTVKGGDGAPGQYIYRKRSLDDLAAGTTSSWGFRDLALDYTYIIELRGKFVAPCFEIKQLGKEALFGLQALAEEMKQQKIKPIKERIAARRKSEGRGGNPISLDGNSYSPRTAYFIIFIFSIGVLVWFQIRFRSPKRNPRE